MDWIQNNRYLLLLEGILLTLLGMTAIALPAFFTLQTELVVGWLFVIGGAVQLYRTYQARGSSTVLSSFLISLLYLGAGLYLLVYPYAGILSLTFLLTVFFIAEGIGKIILGFQFRPVKQWGWLVLNGIIALILAYLIWSGWPGTAFWVIGLLVGINLIFFGMSIIFLSLNTDLQSPPQNKQ